MGSTRIKTKNFHLLLHRTIVVFLYVSGISVAYILLSIPDAHKDFISSLSAGAILATFGSAISTVGSLWTGDYSNRISLNVDILYRDILKQESWRRWPFLLRNGTKKLFGGDIHQFELQNPKIRLFVGSHSFDVLVPTVQDDFFDLPLFKNIAPLLWFRTAAHTTMSNAPKDDIFPENGLKPMTQYMAYECLLDIWWGVLIFRSARYVIHFGAALTISSTIIGGAAALASAV